jgi:hypothetical protein
MAVGSLVETVEKVGPNLTLSQIVARLIERWDSMSDEEKLAVQLCIDRAEAVGEDHFSCPRHDLTRRPALCPPYFLWVWPHVWSVSYQALRVVIW